MPYKNLVELYKYKELKDPQPSPLPPGTGIVSVKDTDGFQWHPVYLAGVNEFQNFEYLHDPHPGRIFQSYKGDNGRRQAIGYLWRRYRRGDLAYSRGWYALLGEQCHLDYCSSGITGNLYQWQRVTVAQAAERLMLPASFIRKLIKEQKIKAHLHTSKSRSRGRDFFSNYYILSLADLEAYLDRYGYGKDYPSYEARQRELGDRRTLPVIVWCV